MEVQEEMNELHLPYPVSANRYWRKAGRRLIRSKEADAYRAIVSGQCMLRGIKPTERSIEVELVYIPKNRNRMDLDNTIKPLLDSLQGFAYENDKQIVRIVADLGEADGVGGMVVRWRNI